MRKVIKNKCATNKEEMNQSLDRLQYLSRAAPLEKQLSFMEVQQRPLGFQTAIPRDPIGEAMNSLEFKSMEGAMYESAAYAGQQMRQEQQEMQQNKKKQTKARNKDRMQRTAAKLDFYQE